jgi:hypothetical protein
MKYLLTTQVEFTFPIFITIIHEVGAVSGETFSKIAKYDVRVECRIHFNQSKS